MTAARLPMIIALISPAATATATPASSLRAASVAGARIPLPGLVYRRSGDAGTPRFAGGCRPVHRLATRWSDAMTATPAVVVLNSP